MEYRIEYYEGQCYNLAHSHKDVIKWLKTLRDEAITDIKKFYKNGVYISVMERYSKFIKNREGKKSMSGMKETLEMRQEELYDFISQDEVDSGDMYDVEGALTEVCNLEPAECMEWMARFAMGIKLLTIDTEYDISILWHKLECFIRDGTGSIGMLEKIWKDFKEIVREGSL